jgi:diguanylate cyclase (GGDEF)-like protein
MPSLANPNRALPNERVGPYTGDRFTRALVGLTRTVWDPRCTFETAIGATCEVAAKAMLIDRVSIWHYDRAAGLLRCLHAYETANDRHVGPDELETLSLEGDDYMAALQDVRTLDAADIDAGAVTASSHGALRDYLRRHRIRGLLDAPACVEGELQAVVSHESIDRQRRWTQQEITFAASMGDYVAMAYEIARRRRAELEVEHLRLHDPVTGLPNREYMVELVRQRLAIPRTRDEVLGIVYVDIEASGGVAMHADTQTTDEVMAHVAQRLRCFIGRDVELARVRPNGFAFLLACNPAKHKAIRLAEQALSAVQGLAWEPREIDPAAAVGIVFAEPAQASDARVLLRQAEEAAARAGTGDKYRYEVYDPEHHDALVEALHFERTLRDAFARGEFELHYQPEYDAADQGWVAAEALLRWRNGDRLVVAGEFIDVVESCGLILPLGSWALQRACMDAAQWPATAAGILPGVRVNVSGRQFDEGGLVNDVQAALSASGLEPARLSLEITETALMRDIEHAERMLRQLKALGVGLAIDDFGTGYASLTYLKRLPVNVLKIDRSFVQCIVESTVDAAIVRAVVGLAQSLDIDVIAEGVETPEQQQALQDMGVRRMQGWLYGKAMDQASTCILLGSARD